MLSGRRVQQQANARLAFRHTTPGHRINHVGWSQPLATDGSSRLVPQLPADAEATLVASHYGLGRAPAAQRLLLALGDNLLVSDDGRSPRRPAQQ